MNQQTVTKMTWKDICECFCCERCTFLTNKVIFHCYPSFSSTLLLYIYIYSLYFFFIFLLFFCLLFVLEEMNGWEVYIKKEETKIRPRREANMYYESQKRQRSVSCDEVGVYFVGSRMTYNLLFLLLQHYSSVILFFFFLPPLEFLWSM